MLANGKTYDQGVRDERSRIQQWLNHAVDDAIYGNNKRLFEALIALSHNIELGREAPPFAEGSEIYLVRIEVNE